MRRIKEKDYILITDNGSSEYLQIGEVIDIEYFPHSDDVKTYKVQFIDKIYEYDNTLEYTCKILMIER